MRAFLRGYVSYPLRGQERVLGCCFLVDKAMDCVDDTIPAVNGIKDGVALVILG